MVTEYREQLCHKERNVVVFKGKHKILKVEGINYTQKCLVSRSN